MNRNRCRLAALMAVAATSLLGAACASPPTSPSTTTTTVPTAPQVVEIAAGVTHSCAVVSTGNVKCWGFNQYGQLGDSSTTTRLSPVDVAGLPTTAVDVAAGDYHTCALANNGAVRCWGFNQYGQLGDRTTNSSAQPTQVAAVDTGAVSVTMGASHTCSLDSAGGISCWGRNLNGQLGDGTTIDRTFPVNVSGLTFGVKAVAAGDFHTCALTLSGAVKCWGLNGNGQLGNGTNVDSIDPVGVIGLSSGVIAIAAGEAHTCALTAAGAVKCWGSALYGQLGNGSTVDRRSPVDVTSLGSGVVSIAAGEVHTCVVLAGGGVSCWGANRFGQLGNGATANSSVPVAVAGLASQAGQVAAGVEHTCVLNTSGMVRCVGANYYGQLGNGTTTNSLSPVGLAGVS
jgi:alpha-tubulin suppressor-like RCC1 family protein